MPSIDTIRRVQIQGSATGINETTAALDKLNASIAAANDNLSRSRVAANSNAEGFRTTGESAAVAANHLRQAAEAAYVLSPAFRSVVNEMAAPALKGAQLALEGVATGLVLATNTAGTGLIKLSTAAAGISPAFAPLSASIKTAGVAMEAFSPSLGGTATTILSKVLPALSLLGKGLLIVDAIRMVAQAWELGGEKLAEYVALSEKAASLNTTTDFLQRIQKAAENAKLPVDALTAALKKVDDSTVGKLGGSDAQNALDKLQGYGNFKGNSGVSQLQNANGTEEKLRALVAIYDQAVAKGERLAALDAIRATLGDTIADKAAKDSGYLDKMLASADAINKTDLVKSQDITNAVELQSRYDAAVKILEQRWHPIQDLLTQAGIGMHTAWVGIVEAIATAVDWVAKLVEKIAQIPQTFWGWIKSGANALGNWAIGDMTPAEKAAADQKNGISSNPTDIASTALQNRLDEARSSDAMADARKRLAEAMNRKFDTSQPPPDKTTPDTAAYDRALDSVLKYIKVTEAASQSVSDAASAQEKLKVVAQLTAAAEKDGTAITADLAKKMDDLGNRAGAAADALAKARVANNIDFDRKTAFLSQEDVSIASQLKGIYGNDVPAALNSTYAAGIRVNNSFKQISSAIEGNLTTGLADIVDGTKSVGQGFADMSKVVIRAIEEMIIKITVVQPLMSALQNSIGGGGILSFLGLGGGTSLNANGSIAGAIGPTSVAGAPLVGLHDGGIVGAEATFSRYVHPSYFDDAPRFHTGGIAGDEVPIIAKRGEGVFTPGQMAAMGGAGSSGKSPNIIINNHTDAQPQVSQGSNGDVTITLKKMVDAAVGDSLSSGTGMRVLNKQYGVKQFAGQ